MRQVTPHRLIEHIAPPLAAPDARRCYALEAALTETVDAVRGAGAGEIHIALEFAGSTSWIRVTGDGEGIDGAGLAAVAPAPPLDHAPGLRGAGLVAAGLLHCDGLSVARRAGPEEPATSVHRWKAPMSGPLSSLVGGDLDLVLEPIQRDAATVVLWQGLSEVRRYQRREGRALEHGLERLRGRITTHLGTVLHRPLEDGLRLTVSGEPVPALPPPRGEAVARYPVLLVHGGSPVELAATVHRGVPGGTGGFHVYAGDLLVQAGGWNRLVSGAGAGSASVCIQVPPAVESAFARNLTAGRVHHPEAALPALRALALLAATLEAPDTVRSTPQPPGNGAVAAVML